MQWADWLGSLMQGKQDLQVPYDKMFPHAVREK